MGNKFMVLVGATLIVIAIIAIVSSQPLYREADMVYWNVDMAQGEQMYMTANIIKYGGFGIGTIGTILLLVGLLNKSEPQPARQQVTQVTEPQPVRQQATQAIEQLHTKLEHAKGINIESLNKITLKQATLYALIGSVIGLIFLVIQIFDYFSVYTLALIVNNVSLVLFFYQLHSKQKGG